MNKLENNWIFVLNFIDFDPLSYNQLHGQSVYKVYQNSYQLSCVNNEYIHPQHSYHQNNHIPKLVQSVALLSIRYFYFSANKLTDQIHGVSDQFAHQNV